MGAIEDPMKMGGRETTHACVICNRDLERDELTYAFELELCDRCRTGGFKEALGARGCTCIQNGGEDNEQLLQSITASFSSALPITASFMRETFKHKFSKFFKKEIQVGVQHFDDLVFIATDTTRSTAKFLKDSNTQDGVLAALLTIVRSGATLRIEGQQLELSVDPRELSTEQDEALRTFRDQLLLTPFCILVAYLDRYCAQHGDSSLLIPT